MHTEPAAMEGAASNDSHARRTLNVLLLAGGPSREREVSLMSGRAIAAGLAEAGHFVTTADISPTDTSALDDCDADVVFIALHGEFGESGEVQELCRRRGLAYTGSGPFASKLGMDKAASKQLFKRAAGLATPDWMVLEQFHAPAMARKWLAELPLPVVVKPVDSGSSVDVTVARTEALRDDAIEELLDLYGRAMIERFIPGRELTVGILGDQALPVLEIIPDGEFYDYRAKYDDAAATRYVFDHGLSPAVQGDCQTAALAAHEALGCRDFSRVDFILDERDVPQVIEINTIPGFTSHSLLHKAAARAGIGFARLTDRIVQLAAARAERA